MTSAWGKSWGKAWGSSWGSSWGSIGGAPVVYSSMGRRRREADERLARLRKDDEIVLAFVRQFVETLHVPR